MGRLLGSYGSIRPADFSPQDTDIFYSYIPSRTSNVTASFIKIPSEEIIFNVNDFTEGNEGVEIGGLYNIKLPPNLFGNRGIYNLYIKPKEIKTKILDCAFLNGTAIKGIIVDRTASGLSDLTSLDGFRIEYYEAGTKIRNFYRIVTSTQIVEPVPSSGTGTPSDRLISYAINDNSSLFFLTLSPSVNIVDGFNTSPYLGVPNQDIRLYNTFFDPILFEFEITDNTIDTIADALYGNHLKNVNTGQYGIFDSEGNIIKSYLLADVKNEFGATEYEIRTEIPNETADLPFNEVDRIVRRGII
jgi:hypothetical protein